MPEPADNCLNVLSAYSTRKKHEFSQVVVLPGLAVGSKRLDQAFSGSRPAAYAELLTSPDDQYRENASIVWDLQLQGRRLYVSTASCLRQR